MKHHDSSHALRLSRNRSSAATAGPTGGSLSFSLTPSSCAHWSYALSFDDASDDTDEVYDFDNFRFVVAREHTEYIQNLKIDFAVDLTGGAFRFDNPLATKSCRCGYAFAIDP
ncbi:MAG: iron-sulfur cluster assembly accessory protein [Cyanobacteria bacterium P01_F01_bin.3]